MTLGNSSLRERSAVVVAMVVLLLAACQPIQPETDTVGAPGLGDPLFPMEGNGGIDVQHYPLDIEWDAATQAITATATLTISPTQTLSAFNLDFHGLTIDSIFVNGAPAGYERNGDELTITLPVLVSSGEPFEVAVAYHGTPEPVPDTVGPGWEATEDGAFVLSEPIAAKNWYPSNNHPSDKASYTVRLTVPKGYSASANGVLEQTVDNGGTETYEFAAGDPMATYLVTVAIGHFDAEEYTSEGGIPIVNYLFAGGTEENRAPFDHMGEMLDLFSGLFGPYPFPVAGATQVGQGLGVALETQTRPIYGAATSENTVAHELTHQWFGDYVGLRTWDNIWLKESLATYGEWLWMNESQGGDQLQNQIVTVYESLMGVQFVPKAQLSLYLDGLEIPAVTVSSEKVAELLALPMGRIQDDKPVPTTLSEAEVSSVVSAVPAEGVTNRDLETLLAELPFDYWKLSPSEGQHLREALGSEMPPLNVDFAVVMAPPPASVQTADPSVMYSTGVYLRGALSLHALRLRVGDETFFEILRTYVQQFGGGTADTEDFIDVAKAVSGQNLDNFFTAWLEDPLIPDLPEYGLRKQDYR